MKKFALILGITMAATAFTLPAYAMGGGMGGGGMMGNRGSGLMDWFQKGQDRGEYTRGQDQRGMTEMDRQHQEDSAYLNYQIQMKEKEMGALLESNGPDMEKVRGLHRDIRDLRQEAAQEQHRYQFQGGTMNPGYRPGDEDDRGAYGPPRSGGNRGMGYGGHMGGYGPDR